MRFPVEVFELRQLFNPAVGMAAAIGAVIAPIFNFIYGDGNMEIMFLLVLLIIMDFIPATANAKRDNVYSSEYGLNGILRALFLLMFPAIANILDSIFAMPGVLFYATSAGVGYHIFNSLVANAYRADWYVPEVLIRFAESEIKGKALRNEKFKEQKKEINKESLESLKSKKKESKKIV